MANETRQLSEFAASLRLKEVPAEVQGRAHDILVDQIGVQIGCSELPWAKQVREDYRRIGGVAEATVVRYGDRLPLASTAFINATFGHSFEYDDANPLIHGHPGAELIPALMAICERDHLSGADFFIAFIAAYELRGRIGWAVSPDMLEHGGPQYSTTCGPFGVAAGAARLLGLGAEGIRQALGIAGTYSGGLMQYDHGGGSVKRIFAAVPAKNGLESALLVQAGMTGAEEILEGKRGLLRMYPQHYRPERLTTELGKKWTMPHVLFKPYSCCAVIHPAIDAVYKLVTAHDLKARDVESIEIDYPKGSYDHSAITDPKDLLGMQFSTQYSLALTVLKRRNTPREYSQEALADPEVRKLASKIRLREDSEMDKLFEDGHMPARARIQTTSGRKLEQMILDAKGSPGAPSS
ncbi:MAG TPA: MmgE/PrpD family protein, partial [Burkholderiales bacterium]|nr:MmgE/PrpD family protein [Burkholderiales bacterium]